MLKCKKNIYSHEHMQFALIIIMDKSSTKDNVLPVYALSQITNFTKVYTDFTMHCSNLTVLNTSSRQVSDPVQI